LLLHEASHGREIAALLEFQEPIPERSDGAAGECRKLINGSDAKLKDVIEEFDVTILKLETIVAARVNDFETLRHGV
jgi:hypothetical protein